jgi:hypothetical protein
MSPVDLAFCKREKVDYAALQIPLLCGLLPLLLLDIWGVGDHLPVL